MRFYCFLLLLALAGCVSIKSYYLQPVSQVARRDSLVVLAAESEQDDTLGYVMSGDTVFAEKYRESPWSGKQEWLIRFGGRLGYVDRKGFPEVWETYGYSRVMGSGSSGRDSSRVHAVYYYVPEPYIVDDSILTVSDAGETLGMLKRGDTVLVWERSQIGSRASYIVGYKGRTVRMSGLAVISAKDYEIRKFLNPPAGDGTGSGHVWQTGSRGGQYYINGNGKKVYKKK